MVSIDEDKYIQSAQSHLLGLFSNNKGPKLVTNDENLITPPYVTKLTTDLKNDVSSYNQYLGDSS